MLVELRVENLLLIERAELRLGPGLNAITGETGAGKTVLAHALDLLLGGRPRAGIVRPGAPEAYVEGAFSAPPGLWEDEGLADLAARLPEPGEEIVLARRVGAEGRSRAFVQGRSASVADLRELGARLVSFYGQHEHRRLTVAAAQLEILDAFCGSAHLSARDAHSALHGRVAELRRRVAELEGREATRERDVDLLRYELDEIEALDPSAEDEGELRAGRERLRRVDVLRGAGAGAAEALAPETSEGAGASAALAAASALAAGAAGIDAELDALGRRLDALAIEADDLANDLRRYAEALDDEPGALEELEERLAGYDRLKRKHGGDVEGVLAHAQRCRDRLDALAAGDAALEHARRELEALEEEEATSAARLSAARAEAAPRLAARVQTELEELAMPGARFAVELEPRESLGPAGAERAEFFLAANAGVSAAPLREVASGGEVSRAMLALMGVASAGAVPTLVFDEVDAGIGGQTARAVGEKLRRLSRGRQVICITHLPQIASLADGHFRIEKSADGELARTTVERLDERALVDELCRMLGADASDSGARRHAEELLAAA